MAQCEQRLVSLVHEWKSFFQLDSKYLWEVLKNKWSSISIRLVFLRAQQFAPDSLACYLQCSQNGDYSFSTYPQDHQIDHYWVEHQHLHLHTKNWISSNLLISSSICFFVVRWLNAAKRFSPLRSNTFLSIFDIFSLNLVINLATMSLNPVRWTSNNNFTSSCDTIVPL